MVRSLRGGSLCLDPTSVEEIEIWFSSRQLSHATCKLEVGFRNNPSTFRVEVYISNSTKLSSSGLAGPEKEGL